MAASIASLPEQETLPWPFIHERLTLGLTRSPVLPCTYKL